ncbi:MAG: Pantoate kinase [Candidatus Heimdallarchaeota archaeon LC_3]|nr:MAG: Pantoate kinase [Candidatus Heimdallarchaeota archaeon LC_3]
MFAKSTYWVAGHITGLFEIHIKSNNILQQGSRGAGFCINRGVKTSVRKEEKNDNLKIFFNDLEIHPSEAIVTKKIIEKIVPSSIIDELTIHHDFEIPIGSGYGASAAGAVGLAFALNNIMKNPLTEENLWSVAHESEIECGSGLGDISGLYQGGTEIRISSGAPGIGETTSFKSLDTSDNLITINLGKLSTVDIIFSKEKQNVISKTGKKFLDSLSSDSSFEKFIELSNKFTLEVKLYSNHLINLIDNLSKLSIKSAQIMLGEGLFFIIPKNKNINNIMSNFSISDSQWSLETICKNTVQKRE